MNFERLIYKVNSFPFKSRGSPCLKTPSPQCLSDTTLPRTFDLTSSVVSLHFPSESKPQPQNKIHIEVVERFLTNELVVGNLKEDTLGSLPNL